MIKLNGEIVLSEKFPNNETKVKDKLDVKTENILELKYESDEDLILLMFVKKELDLYTHQKTHLFIWYMPYSRMDRKIEGDVFTLQHVSEFFGWLDFESICVMEPHSEVTKKELSASSEYYNGYYNIKDIYPACDWLEEVKKEIGFTKNDHVVFPDKGAAARYKDKGYENVCVMEKKRDPSNGRIITMDLKDGYVNPDSKCIIIDDLCSRGGTFALAANILKAKGAGEIYLIVTHCEKTIFEGTLLDEHSNIKKIYTSTSMMAEEHPKICYMDVDVRKYIK